MAACVVPGAASAGDPHTVGVTDFEFNPDVVPGLVGDESATVAWTWQQGMHNVRQDDRLFRSGDPTTAPETYARRFSAGTFHYYCEFHGQSMDGLIKTRPAVGTANHGGNQFVVRWATSDTNVGNAFDVQFKAQGASDWRTWRNDTETLQGSFGQNGNPVNPGATTTYLFRARTEKSVNRPAKASDWSPVATAAP